MPEPTIPEAVVEAAAKSLFELVHPQGRLPSWEQWRSEFGPGDSYHRQARAALAAAEPLMHEGHHAVIERLYAENARYREALFKTPLRDVLAAVLDDAALAPSDEEPGT